MYQYLLFIILSFSSQALLSQIHHLMKVELDPSNHYIRVLDEIDLLKKGTVTFKLNSSLKINEIIGATIKKQITSNTSKIS